MTRLDGLRPPGLLDPERARYKDWLHLNVLDHETGLIGLVNVALHGPPEDPRSRAVGTALVNLPDGRWHGGQEVVELRAAQVTESHVGLPSVALGLDPGAGTVLASVRMPASGLSLDAVARVDGPALTAPGRLPLGCGWIGWFAVPRLRLSGRIQLDGRATALAGLAYHDHNWGRWRWGDDFGWAWGCFLAAGGGLAVVLSRTTDREHHRSRTSLLDVVVGGRRRTFTGAAVTIEYAGDLAIRPRRLPGALAALHTDRARPRLPAHVHIRANDGREHVDLTFTARAAAQVIAAEVTGEAGYGFIHELPGRFAVEGRACGGPLRADGLGIFEHVD